MSTSGKNIHARAKSGRFRSKASSVNQADLDLMSLSTIQFRGPPLTHGQYLISVDLSGVVTEIVRTDDGKEEIPNSLKKNAIDEAKEIIYGDREKTYGRPDKNLNTIAELWNSYIKGKYGQMLASHGLSSFAIYLVHTDVAMMMILLKIAREINHHNRDNPLDMIGYAALIDRIEEGDCKDPMLK